LLARYSSPHVCTRIEADWFAYATSPLDILLDDIGDLFLDISESIERNIRNFVFNTILLKAKTSTGEEDVRLPSRG
jgi:hypothetical protein